MSILILRPADDNTAQILEVWGQAFINLANAFGFANSDVAGANVTRAKVDTAMLQHDHVLWFGHGLDDELIAHGLPMIDSANLLSNSGGICIAIACHAANGLGQLAGTSASSALIGFDDEFTIPAKAPLPMQLALRRGLECLFRQRHDVACATDQLREEFRLLRDEYKQIGAGLGLTAGETRLAWMCAKNNQYSLQLSGNSNASL